MTYDDTSGTAAWNTGRAFEYAYEVLKESEPNSTVDTARGIYVPTDRARRIWTGGWIAKDTHIQLCVRNLDSLRGAWLHDPTGLGVNDVCEALQAGVVDVEPEDSQGKDQTEANVEAEEA